jgi:hypothetical protein
MVLIIVMIVIIMLSLAGFGFAALMFTENKAAVLHGDELFLEQVVASGEEYIRSVLRSPRAERDATGGIYDNPDHFQGVMLSGDGLSGANESIPRAMFSVVSPRIENGELTGLRFGLEDESARLNLAALLEWERRTPGAARRALLNLPGIDEPTADAILDWIDADSQPRPQGAEDDYYGGLEPPYAARNGAPLVPEELLLIKGVTYEQLFGADTNRNHFVDELETQEAEVRFSQAAAADFLTPWSRFLTICSRERNVTPDGRPRIDLNSDQLSDLSLELSSAFPQSWVQFLIAYRQFGPYSGGEPAVASGAVPLDLSGPPAFRFESVLDVIDARVQIPASGAEESATVIESPFGGGPDQMREYLPKLLDYVTLDPQMTIVGRVNINQAPAEVLKGVPGLNGALADQILAGRNMQTAHENPGRRHATWLLAERVVDLETMKSLMPYVTGAGDVFRAQIVGFFEESPISLRMEVVVDGTTDPPRQVYRKDLRALGQAYPPELLGKPTEGMSGAPATRP